MGISIKNEEVEELIRELAHETGLSTTEALKYAISDFLRARDAQIRENAERDVAHVMRMAQRIAAMPVKDTRPHGQMLYDEAGLPR